MTTPAELKQLLADRDWRMNNLYRITDKAGQVVPFRMNESQARFWVSIHAPARGAAPVSSCLSWSTTAFQSTPPRGGRQSSRRAGRWGRV